MSVKLCGRSLLHLVLVMVLALAIAACAAMPTGPVSSSSGAVEKRVEETVTRSDSFPQALGEVLRQDLGKRSGVAPDQVRLVKTTAKTWPNGCLGLAKPDEFCTEMLVEGWQVVLTDGKQQWTYHTDRTGRNYRIQAP